MYGLKLEESLYVRETSLHKAEEFSTRVDHYFGSVVFVSFSSECDITTVSCGMFSCKGIIPSNVGKSSFTVD